MPSGKVHDQLTAMGAIAAVPVWWYFTPPPQDWTTAGTLGTGILFAGWFLSPDLDLDSSVYRRWGPLRFLWWPYQKLVPHRSWVSHSWLLSPMLRVSYLLFVTYLLSWGVLWAMRQASGIGPGAPQRTPWDLVQELYTTHPQHTIMAALGLVIGTALHSGADTVTTFFKRRF